MNLVPELGKDADEISTYVISTADTIRYMTDDKGNRILPLPPTTFK